MYLAHELRAAPSGGSSVASVRESHTIQRTSVSQPQNSDIRVIALVSGKGGVGKTNLAANLSIMMARRGRRVLLVDADLGLANIDIILGLTTRFTLYDVVRGQVGLADILVEGPGGIWVLPASSGAYEMTCLNDQQRYSILDQIDTLEERFDTVLIDNSAGITQDVQFFAGAAREVIVVTDREPTAITDAYATIKVFASGARTAAFISWSIMLKTKMRVVTFTGD